MICVCRDHLDRWDLKDKAWECPVPQVLLEVREIVDHQEKMEKRDHQAAAVKSETG